MANGRMNFDQFEDDEMNYILREFTKCVTKEDKKKIPKLKKDTKEKIKTKVVNNKKKLYEFINDND